MKKIIFLFLSFFLVPLTSSLHDPFNTGVMLDFGHLFSKDNPSIRVKFTSDYLDLDVNKTKKMIATVRSKMRELRVDYALWDDLAESWERKAKDYLLEGRVHQLCSDDLDLGLFTK